MDRFFARRMVVGVAVPWFFGRGFALVWPWF